MQEEWNATTTTTFPNRIWSEGQKEAIAKIEDGIENTDPDLADRDRWLYINGKPGSGKNEVLAYSAMTAAQKGTAVMILCPTGTLLCNYREKLGDSERIDVETLHSAFVIRREADDVVQYAPPTRLRRYDIFLIDEASQVEDEVFKKVIVAIRELPQRPMVCIAADMQQLRPVGSGGMMRSLLANICSIELKTIYRSTDPDRLLFLNTIRDKQPDKNTIATYFAGRHWNTDLDKAARNGLAMQTSIQDAFMWLTTKAQRRSTTKHCAPKEL